MSLTAPGRALRRHRFAQAGTLSVALALALTACGGQSEPAESSTTSPSSAKPAVETSAPASTSETAGVSSSPTATESESGEYVPASADGPARNVPKPEMPAAMKEETKEGAEATIRYFWEAIYYTDQTGETADFDSTYSEYCELCQAVSDSTAQHYKEGGWSTGERTSIKSLTLTPSEFGYTATLVRDASAVEVFDSQGVRDDSASGAETHDETWLADVVYEPSKGHWVIDEMQNHQDAQ